MKRVICIVPVLAIFIFSCKKGDNNAGNNGNHNTDYWFKTNNEIFYPDSVISIHDITNKMLIATDDSGNICYLVFGKYPTANGLFKITDDPQDSANEISIIAQTKSLGRVTATGSDNQSATVSVDPNGKISVVVPPSWAAILGNFTDSVKISCNLKQTK